MNPGGRYMLFDDDEFHFINATLRRGGATIVGGLYRWVLLQQGQDWRKRIRAKQETAAQMRRRLLLEVERRLQEQDDDDLVTVLAV